MTSRLAVLLASTVLLTACGSAGSDAGGGPSASGEPAGSDPSAGASAFPVVIERRGGIAGFRDRVSVSADGTASVSTKQGARPDCPLGADTAARLGAAVSALASATPTATPTGVSDVMVVTLQGPTTGALVVPDDPQDPVTVVSEVLTRATSATCG